MDRRDDWNHYAYTYGAPDEKQTKAEVHFDVMSAVMPDEETPVVRVIGPVVSEAAMLAALADADGMLVGILRYADRVELVLRSPGLDQTHDAALCALDCVCSQVDGGYFSERVSPSPTDWRRIQDREALDKLDLDASGDIRVLHQFYGDAAGLDRVRAALATEPFEEVAAAEGRAHLVGVHPVSDLSTYTIGLMRLCDRNRVVYDGWVLPG